MNHSNQMEKVCHSKYTYSFPQSELHTDQPFLYQFYQVLFKDVERSSIKKS